ncbi:MAG: hypothetical protein A3C44_00520 [Gammaproteobacteria bacterium RIFCSPHIGHO2_02_FULL_39_13]|nr:MAG: hypothetical protein A3C44_00520 [Gammaproteobacteria bacterium RIFCSPHIGHO2_02_FULL_39_13]OGT48708.1 MAG: hypothetical protein A3E53_05490 [Gammaproteobacteria bacterium RIFCSPHIGHO2_12_FULL_39_24]
MKRAIDTAATMGVVALIGMTATAEQINITATGTKENYTVKHFSYSNCDLIEKINRDEENGRQPSNPTELYIETGEAILGAAEIPVLPGLNFTHNCSGYALVRIGDKCAPLSDEAARKIVENFNITLLLLMQACRATKDNCSRHITAVNVNATAGNTRTSFGMKMVVGCEVFHEKKMLRNGVLKRHNEQHSEGRARLGR